jgi:Holliday junction resolvase RusA-like endonuclease
MAVSSDVVRIVVTGAPQPYRERTGIATSKGPNGERMAVMRNGRPIVWSFKPAHVKTYQDHLRRAAEDAMGERPLFEGAVSLTIRAYMPMPKTMRKADRLLAERELLPHTVRPDLDNLTKAAKDALKGRVWRDDSQAAMYDQSIKVYSPRPRLEIEVRAITTIGDVQPTELADGDKAPFVRFVQGALL